MIDTHAPDAGVDRGKVVIRIGHDDAALTPAQARELAQDLLDLAAVAEASDD